MAPGSYEGKYNIVNDTFKSIDIKKTITMMHTEDEVHASIKQFASTISQQPLGLAHYRPHSDAIPTNCIANVHSFVEMHGGQVRYGWYFLFRHSLDNGHYLIATHHVVWHNPFDHTLVDVTPFHTEEKHRPIIQDGDPLFLVDDKAQPFKTGNLVIPLPLRFWAMGNELKIQGYVSQLQREEYESYNQEYGSSFS